MKKTITTIILTIIILTTLTTTINAEQQRVAMGPAIIREPDAQRNQTYSYTLYIYNQNNYTATVTLNTSGQMTDWIKIYENNYDNHTINEITIPKYTDTPVTLKISVPASAANKEYMGFIASLYKFHKNETQQEGNISSTQIGPVSTIKYNVTGDQILNLSVNKITIDNIETGQTALFKIDLINKGNVGITAKIDIEIEKENGIIVDRLTKKSYYINKGEISKQTIQWETTGLLAGNYTAKFNISIINSDKHYHYNKTFTIYPEGYFPRKIILKELKYEGDFEKGNIVKIIAIGKNQENINTKASFKGYVYLNGKLIKNLSTNELLIPKYQSRTFTTELEIEEEGTYTIEGKLLYWGHETETTTIKISTNQDAASSINSYILLIIFIIIIGIFIFIEINKRKIKQPKKEKSKPKTKVDGKKVPKTLAKEEKKKIREEKKASKIEGKTEDLRIEDMSAKELEEYVKNL